MQPSFVLILQYKECRFCCLIYYCLVKRTTMAVACAAVAIIALLVTARHAVRHARTAAKIWSSERIVAVATWTVYIYLRYRLLSYQSDDGVAISDYRRCARKICDVGSVGYHLHINSPPRQILLPRLRRLLNQVSQSLLADHMWVVRLR